MRVEPRMTGEHQAFEIDRCPETTTSQSARSVSARSSS
jgi:hypothetical protein